MKIVDRKTFLAMPSQTLFSKYQPCHFGDLMIKTDTLYDYLDREAIDFTYQDINSAIDNTGSDDFDNILDNAEKTGCEIKMDLECEGRDGMFDEDQLFAVWSEEDVKLLIDRLNKCL